MATPLLNYASRTRPPDTLRTAFVALMDALRSRARRLLAITAGVLVALIPIGCASNSASAAACEKRVANWVATTVLHGRAFYVGTGMQNADALTRLPGAVARTDAGTTGGTLFPWARVGTARTVAPFIVEVHYQWFCDNRVGAGGRRRFLCMFGNVIPLGD